MRHKLLSIILLLLISSFFIFYKYDQIPQGLNHDENELARVAFSLENKPYTTFTPVADGHGTPYFYILLLSFKIFGVNQFALRLPSRIFGILIVILFYLIVKRVFYNRPALSFILSLILLTSRWYLHFIRFSFEMPFLLFLELLSLYFILSFLDNNKKIFLLLSGIFAGIAFNSYQPGRIFFLVPLAALILQKKGKSILYFLVMFLICITPISLYLLTHPENDIRINQQFFLKNNRISLAKKGEYLSDNIQRTIFMFFTKGDVNGTHNYPGKPALNPILALFFLSGLAIAIFKFKNFYNMFFLLYLLVALAPTILTYPWENPNMLRTYTVLPSIIYLVGQSILFLLSFFKKKNKYCFFISLFFVFSLIFFSSFYEMRTYFKYQPLVFRQAFDKPDYLKLIRKNTLK